MLRVSVVCACRDSGKDFCQFSKLPETTINSLIGGGKKVGVGVIVWMGKGGRGRV